MKRIQFLSIFSLAMAAFSNALLAGSALGDDGESLMCVKDKLLFEDAFETGKVSDKWKAAKGEWTVVDGALKGVELEADNHAASIRTNVDLPANIVLQFDFKFDGGKVIHCSFNGKGHICRATITPTGYSLKGEKDKKNPADKSVTIGQVQQKFEAGKWYTMVIELAGKEFVARVDDGPVAFGEHEKVARGKNNFGFPMAGVSSSLDNIKVWSATVSPNWADAKSKLPPNKIVPPAAPTPKQRFERLDQDKSAGLSLKEFIGARPKDKHAVAEKQFKNRDKDKNGELSFAEYAPVRKKK
jgi:hypothetical protein